MKETNTGEKTVNVRTSEKESNAAKRKTQRQRNNIQDAYQN